MDDAEPVVELMNRWHAGEPQAATRLYERYAQRLTRLAEQHLGRNLAARLDGEDVMQSVFRTFFRRSSEGEFRIDSSGQLWRLLVTITLRKAGALARHHTAARRDVGVEARAAADALLPEAVAHEPTPEEAAALVDQIELLVRGLPTLYSRVLEMRLEGYSAPQIAEALGVSHQTVYRAMDLLQRRLSRAEA